MRAEFEAVAAGYPHRLPLEKGASDQYLDPRTNVAWLVWQEARSTAQPAPAGEPIPAVVKWLDTNPWMQDFLKRGSAHVHKLYNGAPDELNRTDIGYWIQVASQMLERSWFAKKADATPTPQQPEPQE